MGRDMIRKGWTAAAVASLLLLSSCGKDATAPRTSRPVVELKGSILGTGRPFGQGLYAYALPDLRGEKLEVREDQQLGFGLEFLGAFWTDRTHAVTFVSDDNGSQLVRASPGQPAEELGPRLTNVFALDVRGERALAATCPDTRGSVRVLDLTRPRAWRKVARSCMATLSPDGARVVFVERRTQVWERPLEGGAASLVLDVADVPGVRDLDLGRRVISQLSWGPAGLAVVVSNERSLGGFSGGRSAVVVRDDDGAVRVVPLAVQDLSLPFRPWQPSGNLLAIIARPSSGGALIRLFDPTNGELRVVAADAQFFGQAAWSPDGRALAATTSGNALLFFDPAGNWIRRIGTGGIGLLDWRA
jgi:hypothetical protein